MSAPRDGTERNRLRREQQRAMRKYELPARRPDHASDPGFYLCGSCGRMAWPDAEQSPHRREAAAQGRPAAPCMHCGQHNWFQLHGDSSALALSKGRPDIAVFGTYAAYMLGTATLGVLLLWITAGLVGKLAWLHLSFLVMAVGGALGALGARRTHRFKLDKRSAAFPARWRFALPPGDGPTQSLRGAPALLDLAVISPITGRACLGYEIAIRPRGVLDDSGDGWSLVEQHVAAFELGGKRWSADQVHLQLPRQRQGVLSEVCSSEAARVYLLERGFDPTSGSLDIYESIVSLPSKVEIDWNDHGATLRVITALDTAALSPDGPG